MRLVEIAKGVSVNPEKVTSVKKETRGINREYKECICVYVGELYEEPGDFSCLMYSNSVISDYSYEETIRRLTGNEPKT